MGLLGQIFSPTQTTQQVCTQCNLDPVKREHEMLKRKVELANSKDHSLSQRLMGVEDRMLDVIHKTTNPEYVKKQEFLTLKNVLKDMQQRSVCNCESNNGSYKLIHKNDIALLKNDQQSIKKDFVNFKNVLKEETSNTMAILEDFDTKLGIMYSKYQTAIPSVNLYNRTQEAELPNLDESSTISSITTATIGDMEIKSYNATTKRVNVLHSDKYSIINRLSALEHKLNGTYRDNLLCNEQIHQINQNQNSMKMEMLDLKHFVKNDGSNVRDILKEMDIKIQMNKKNSQSLLTTDRSIFEKLSIGDNKINQINAKGNEFIERLNRFDQFLLDLTRSVSDLTIKLSSKRELEKEIKHGDSVIASLRSSLTNILGTLNDFNTMMVSEKGNAEMLRNQIMTVESHLKDLKSEQHPNDIKDDLEHIKSQFKYISNTIQSIRSNASLREENPGLREHIAVLMNSDKEMHERINKLHTLIQNLTSTVNYHRPNNIKHEEDENYLLNEENVFAEIKKFETSIRKEFEEIRKLVNLSYSAQMDNSNIESNGQSDQSIDVISIQNSIDDLKEKYNKLVLRINNTTSSSNEYTREVDKPVLHNLSKSLEDLFRLWKLYGRNVVKNETQLSTVLQSVETIRASMVVSEEKLRQLDESTKNRFLEIGERLNTIKLHILKPNISNDISLRDRMKTMETLVNELFDDVRKVNDNLVLRNNDMHVNANTSMLQHQETAVTMENKDEPNKDNKPDEIIHISSKLAEVEKQLLGIKSSIGPQNNQLNGSESERNKFPVAYRLLSSNVTELSQKVERLIERIDNIGESNNNVYVNKMLQTPNKLLANINSDNDERHMYLHEGNESQRNNSSNGDNDSLHLKLIDDERKYSLTEPKYDPPEKNQKVRVTLAYSYRLCKIICLFRTLLQIKFTFQ